MSAVPAGTAGAAPLAVPSGLPYWPNWDIARGIAIAPDGNTGFVLDGFGGVHPFGGAPASPSWNGVSVEHGPGIDDEMNRLVPATSDGIPCLGTTIRCR